MFGTRGKKTSGSQTQVPDWMMEDLQRHRALGEELAWEGAMPFEFVWFEFPRGHPGRHVNLHDLNRYSRDRPMVD